MEKRVPVVILTGYLGSGKTTLLNYILTKENNPHTALIINDMGSVNIDAAVLKQAQGNVQEGKMVELQNGCICCTLQEEFMTQIQELSQKEGIERILVEASGISNPASIAEGFLNYEEMLGDGSFYLDSILTVVDADRIYNEFLEEFAKANDDDPDIINLVMDQIEFANIVILNKCDLLSAKELEEVKQVLRSLQREATFIECAYGEVEIEKLYQGIKFDYEKVMRSSALQRALEREERMESEMDEYGISTFVYEKMRPFDYEKFMHFIEEEYPKELIRAKGYIWFADDDMHVQLFEQAGRNASVSEVSNWVAALSKEEQKEIFMQYPDVLEGWDEHYGDRMNQIVFIGRNYQKEKIEQALDACVSEK